MYKNKKKKMTSTPFWQKKTFIKQNFESITTTITTTTKPFDKSG
jgi:hypothetical protein